MSLYEWIQCATRIKKPTKKTPNIQDNSEVDTMPHIESTDTAYDLNANCHHSDQDSDYDELCNNSYDDNNKDMYFLNEHPLYDTHCIKFDSRRKILSLILLVVRYPDVIKETENTIVPLC